MNNIKKVFLGFVLVVTLVVVGPVSQSSAATYEEILAQIKALESRLQQIKSQPLQQLSSDNLDADDFSYIWNTDLRRGMRNNNDVRALQQALTIEGFYKGKIDGNFFKSTRSAVIKFQKKYGLKKNGIVGKAMREELNEIYGPDNDEVSPDNNDTVTTTPTNPTTTTPRPSITITSPNGGEVWYPGETRRITWNSDLNKIDVVNIYIYDPSISGSGNTLAIAAGTSTPNPKIINMGYYDWTIPSLDKLPGFGRQGSKNYRIVVSYDSYISSIQDSSDGPFSIVAPKTSSDSSSKNIGTITDEQKVANIYAGIAALAEKIKKAR